jgi:hypothetical protein
VSIARFERLVEAVVAADGDRRGWTPRPLDPRGRARRFVSSHRQSGGTAPMPPRPPPLPPTPRLPPPLPLPYPPTPTLPLSRLGDPAGALQGTPLVLHHLWLRCASEGKRGLWHYLDTIDRCYGPVLTEGVLTEGVLTEGLRASGDPPAGWVEQRFGPEARQLLTLTLTLALTLALTLILTLTLTLTLPLALTRRDGRPSRRRRPCSSQLMTAAAAAGRARRTLRAGRAGRARCRAGVARLLSSCSPAHLPRRVARRRCRLPLALTLTPTLALASPNPCLKPNPNPSTLPAATLGGAAWLPRPASARRLCRARGAWVVSSE